MSKFDIGDRVFSEEYGEGTVVGFRFKGGCIVRYDNHNEELHDGDLGEDGYYWWENDKDIIKLSEAQESSVKPSNTVTLTITFPEETDVLEGVFEANGESYKVSIDKKVKEPTYHGSYEFSTKDLKWGK